MSKMTQPLDGLICPADAQHKSCKPAGRPKAADVEARQQELVQAAARLFLEHGYSAVSLEMIARAAHVAVRTIYIKFGGKAGLLKAAIEANRQRFFTTQDLDEDKRPMREALTEFAHHFYDMITAPQAVRMKQVIVAEANRDPELLDTFMSSGPIPTRQMLERYFNRPDTRAQMRDDVPLDHLPNFFLNCVMGDHFTHLLVPGSPAFDAGRSSVDIRLDLFFRAVQR